ncbi:hypothetical protein TRFO_04336 [Tritrichomonas foetus]|uniref:Peptidase M60 domain-containing protein n=1 Tax=Tritrichomonas foetus TaxID=1144522 RepID=A0A1J4KGX0_9EUKA|nr:hypothetical protein TRFO_04336 [Tritrichomonas foetus]|eukprot:OHT10298.1 hypothetical protein TRFO_04336 [Tritrichomonas foetus]
MGCCASVPAQSPRISAQQSPQNMKVTAKKNGEKVDAFHPCQTMFSDHKQIMSGVTRLPKPGELDFVVCLTETSIPLAICPISFDENDPCPIILPVLGISAHENGRAIACGSIEILLDCKQENAEFLAFLENLLHFAAGPRPPSPLVYLLGLDPQDANMLIHNMGGLGFAVEIGDSVENLAKYAVVITMCSSPHGESLYEYMVNGGGIIVCSGFNQTFRINKWLAKCGLAFPDAHTTTPVSQKASIRANLRASELEKSTFPYFVEVYRDLLLKSANSEHIEIEDLILVISYLRYHILSLDHGKNSYLSQIIEISFDYLKQSNYEQPEGIFYSKIQGFIAILLSDAICHTDPSEFENKVYCEHFPGKYCPEELNNVELKFTLQTPTWHSTGLWLPPGVISTVSISSNESTKSGKKIPHNPSNNLQMINHLNLSSSSKCSPLVNTPNTPLSSSPQNSNSQRFPDISPRSDQATSRTSRDEIEDYFDDISIQIGCHSESLLESPGPWKRWPVIVDTFKFNDQQEITIGSPFGGILYVCSENRDGRVRVLNLSFTNVCFCPYYRGKDNWITPKESDVPWGEVQTNFASITAPTSYLKKYPNLDTFAKTLDAMIKELYVFTGSNPKRRFRIVFDIDRPKNGSTSAYPLMLGYDMIDPIFSIDEPSSELFSLIMMLAITTLPENALDPNIEAAFGALTAAHVFKKSWKKINPVEFIYEHTSPVFKELWKIYSENDVKLIPTALVRFHQHLRVEKTSFEDSIKSIVDEMASIADKDFSKLLEEALHPSEDEQFPLYIPADEEEEEEGE